MIRPWPFVVAFAAILVSGVAHGIWTQRWLTSNDLRTASEGIATLPLELPDWECEEAEMTPAEQDQAEIYAYRKVRYIHRTTRADVHFLIMCGRPGPIAVHTPDICYLGAGFTQAGLRKRVLESNDGSEAIEYQVGLFVRRDETGLETLQRTFWTLTNKGKWEVPGDLRFAYARQRVLYKLYLSRGLLSRDEPLDKDPCLDLLRAVMPQIQKHLFSPSPPADPT